VKRSNATLVVGATAIALFAVACILFIWRADSAPPKRESAPGPMAAEPTPLEPAASTAWTSPAPRPAATHAGVAAAPVAEGVVLAPEQVDPAWNDVRLTSRLQELGAVAPYVNMGLKAAREAMSHCFAAEQAAGGDLPGSARGVDEDTSPAVLLLYLEARDRAIDVVEVAVESLGASSPQLVSCCREVLRGHEIRSPNTTPGRRYRLRYPLH